MPYVSRDAENRITAIYAEPQPSAQEELKPTHPAILRFLYKHESPKFSQTNDLLDMQLSDLGMVRVIEDIIDVLIEKRLIAISDLPEAAIDRLRTRKSIRHQLDEFKRVIDEEFDISTDN